MQRIAVFMIMFLVLSGRAYGFTEKEGEFSWRVVDGDIALYFNDEKVEHPRETKSLFRDLTDPTCWKYYKRYRFKTHMSSGLLLSGLGLIGYAFGHATKPGADQINHVTEKLMFWTGVTVLVSGTFVSISADESFGKAVEHYNRSGTKLRINFNSIGIARTFFF